MNRKTDFLKVKPVFRGYIAEFDDSFSSSEGNFVTSISKTRKATTIKFCIRNAFMVIMTHAKFQFNRLMLILSFGIRTSEPPRAWRTTEKAEPDRVNVVKFGYTCTELYA